MDVMPPYFVRQGTAEMRHRAPTYRERWVKNDGSGTLGYFGDQRSSGNWTAFFVLIFERTHIVHKLYFESAAMIVILITVGKMLEAHSKGKTTNAIKGLMALSPDTASVLRDGKEIKKK